MTNNGKTTRRQRRRQPTHWTRPQQILAAGYGLWSALWTLVVAVVLLTPANMAATMERQGYAPDVILGHTSNAAHGAGIAGAVVSAILCLVIAYFSYRGHVWIFWVGLVWFAVTGLGALWVPLRPQAHVGEDAATIFVHAFVNDLPGLIVAAWMLIGLVRYRGAWGRRAISREPLGNLTG